MTDADRWLAAEPGSPLRLQTAEAVIRDLRQRAESAEAERKGCDTLLKRFVARAESAEEALAALRSTVDQIAQERDDALRLAKQAVNGWACYARRKLEHDEIARLHAAIDELRADRLSRETADVSSKA